jgi:hypothetical protein
MHKRTLFGVMLPALRVNLLHFCCCWPCLQVQRSPRAVPDCGWSAADSDLLLLLLPRSCRSNAVRVLCQIVDGQLLAQIERYLKQAVVDKSPVVAASVLVSAVHLIKNVSSSSMGPAEEAAASCWQG